MKLPLLLYQPTFVTDRLSRGFRGGLGRRTGTAIGSMLFSSAATATAIFTTTRLIRLATHSTRLPINATPSPSFGDKLPPPPLDPRGPRVASLNDTDVDVKFGTGDCEAAAEALLPPPFVGPQETDRLLRISDAFPAGFVGPRCLPASRCHPRRTPSSRGSWSVLSDGNALRKQGTSSDDCTMWLSKMWLVYYLLITDKSSDGLCWWVLQLQWNCFLSLTYICKIDSWTSSYHRQVQRWVVLMGTSITVKSLSFSDLHMYDR